MFLPDHTVEFGVTETCLEQLTFVPLMVLFYFRSRINLTQRTAHRVQSEQALPSKNGIDLAPELSQVRSFLHINGIHSIILSTLM